MQTASFQKRIHIAENIHTTDCTEVSILKVLAYFDIFQYPLTKKEIKQFLDKTVTDNELERALHRLLEDATIFQLSDFYSLQDNLFLAEKRAAGNLRADR